MRSHWGETAEMPSLYQKNHFDMAGFLVGLKLNQERLRVKKNDLIMGVKSNGFHSNGYSLIRKIIKDNKINLKKTKIGKKKLSEVLMQPTRLYHELVNESDLKKIKALSHITGGGVISNFKRSLPKNLKFEINLPSLPKEYEFIFDNIKITEKELMEVFNCGVGLVIVIDKTHYRHFINKKYFNLIGEIY